MHEDDHIPQMVRANREAGEPPMFNATPENRSRIQFYWFLGSSLFVLIAGIVTATVTFISLTSSITTNKTDVATVKADVATVRAEAKADIATVKAEEKSEVKIAQAVAEAARDLAKDNKTVIDARGPILDKLVAQMAGLLALQLDKAAPLAIDMANQRDYGVSNEKWYLSKHNFPPPGNALTEPPARK